MAFYRRYLPTVAQVVYEFGPTILAPGTYPIIQQSVRLKSYRFTNVDGGTATVSVYDRQTTPVCILYQYALKKGDTVQLYLDDDGASSPRGMTVIVAGGNVHAYLKLHLPTCFT